MSEKVLSRRALLRGTGGALIALPLLEELVPERAQAQNGGVPRRVLTLSFGLGIERSLQAEGAQGPLQPLMQFAPKAAFFSNLKNSHLEGSGTVHFKSGATQFTGRRQDGYNAGGPSIEQIVKDHHHPNGVPSVTGVPSISAGIWSRTGAVSQYTRHWNNDGSPGPRPERRPSKVFETLFGDFQAPPTTIDPGAAPDPARLIENHIQRSVLDAVKEQHDHMVGARSPLGTASKARIDNHLTQIRQVERRLVVGDAVAASMERQECAVPNAADFTDPDGIDFYDNRSGPTGGPQVPWEATQEAYRLSGKLIALGFACDALRFGSMIFYGSGGHIRFRGNYEAEPIGQSLNFTNTFTNDSPHHLIFHAYNKNAIRVYQHYCLSQIGYVLEQLDGMTEVNGKTVLDNSLAVVGTEYGKNHDATKEIFHAVIGGEGKFKPGQYDGNHGLDDLYRTLMEAYEIPNSGIGGNTIGDLLV